MNEPKINYALIGKRIKSAREEKGWSQGTLGSKLSKPLTATAISLYENGERDISVDVLTEIADLFDLSVEYLIKGVQCDVPPVHVALRADQDLSKKARDQILDFIDYVKSKSKD